VRWSTRWKAKACNAKTAIQGRSGQTPTCNKIARAREQRGRNSAEHQTWQCSIFHPAQISAQQRESHIREAAAAMALALAFLRNRMGLVSSPPKPVSEFAPTRLKQVKDARK
jgi:hypothetical protein